MKKFMKIFTVVGLLFSLSIGIIYADSKDIPEDRQVQLQYGYASSYDGIDLNEDGTVRQLYRTNGTCKNSQAVVAVYIRDKNRKLLSQRSCAGYNKSTYTTLTSDSAITHIHTALLSSQDKKI